MQFKKIILALAMAAVLFAAPAMANKPTAAELDKSSREALAKLYKTNNTAKILGEKAKGILVFPKIVKGGFIFGGSYGEGALIEGGKTHSYYASASASWGLQAGAQAYSYVVFLMTDKMVKYVHDTHGWEFGVGPTVVLVDEGVAKNLSTSTLKEDAYAFVFGQQGLMAGISLEGSKITPVKRY